MEIIILFIINFIFAILIFIAYIIGRKDGIDIGKNQILKENLIRAEFSKEKSYYIELMNLIKNIKG